MKKNWQAHFLNLISGKAKNPLSLSIRGLLHIPSWFYRVVVSARNWAFDHGYFEIYNSQAPLVISIGNIVAGGTGKTPTTLMLAQALGAEEKIAILTRGYRSRAETLPTPIILSRGKGPLYAASYCGDEPYLLAQRVPKATVIVGKNRRIASQMALQAGAKMLLLDDGMQHRHLARHFDVVVVDASNPFGHGHLLPRGLLREPAHALSRAHFIILSHVKDKEHYDELCIQLNQHTKVPVIGTQMHIDQIWHSAHGKISDLNQKRVGVFCGIANPDRFMKTVESTGSHVVAHRYYPDHHQFDQQTLEGFANECTKKGAEVLVCTEKDYVKLKGCFYHSLPLVWLEMKTTVVFGKEHWTAFVDQAKTMARI
jgi:tetraacyldisaccharide 4'-kinase